MGRKFSYKNKRPSAHIAGCWCVFTQEGALKGEQWWFWSKRAAVEFLGKTDGGVDVKRVGQGYYTAVTRIDAKLYHLGTYPALMDRGFAWAINVDMKYEGESYIMSTATPLPPRQVEE